MTPKEMADLMAQAMPDARCWDAAEFAELMARPGAVTLADGASLVIGQVVMDVAEIFLVLTHSAKRRSGLGKLAMSAFHERARAQGAVRVILEVAADNVAARALYDSLGYGQIAERKAYYRRKQRPAVAALMLEKRL